MNNQNILPENYKIIENIDLMKNKKQAIIVNLSAVILMIIMVMAGIFAVPISIDFSQGMTVYCLKFAVLIGGSIVYIILHELVHGIFMKVFGAEKVKFGYKVIYAYAGSQSYFNKKSYIIIALAPVVIWGIILAILTSVVPAVWFWPVYFIQIFNISGAAGDFYVTLKMIGMPEDILIKDTGTEMNVYSSE
ncbi:MAG: DUF3267 domain-containing protein [Oscillospiraceae bacterium]